MKSGYKITNNIIAIDATPSIINIYENSKINTDITSVLLEDAMHIIKTCDAILSISFDDNNEPHYYAKIRSWKTVINSVCLISSFIIDFQITIRELLLAKNHPEQMYYVKVMYILLFRYYERITFDLRIIRSAAIEFEKKKLFDVVAARVSAFRKKYCDRINKKRNTYYAHIAEEKDYLKYHKDQISMVFKSEIDICNEFLATLEGVSKLTSILISEMSKQIKSVYDVSIDILEKITALKSKTEDVEDIDSKKIEEIKLDYENILATLELNVEGK